MKPLSETAADRLETIAVNNDLGSGMQVALKDLELRGAGNLLGAEQAGHIAGVGFDLYLRMIGEAVATFRGDEVDGPTELRLELPIDARLPESYIDSERLRLEAYQKLSAAASPDAHARRGCRVLHRPDRPRDRGAQTATARRRAKSTGSSPSRACAAAPLSRASATSSRWGRTCGSCRHRHPILCACGCSGSIRSRRCSRGRGDGRAAADRGGEPLGDGDLIAWVAQLIDQLYPLPVAEAVEA
jgi:transcription-repair coupling factor (superfamily II helicase)